MASIHGTIELKSFIHWLKSLPDEEMFWQGEVYLTSPFAIYIMRKNKPLCVHCNMEHKRNTYVRVDQYGFTTLNQRGYYSDYVIFPKWCRDIHIDLTEMTTPKQVLDIINKYNLK